MDKRTCSIDGCDKPTRSASAQWCAKHYHRWYRHGDPLTSLLPGNTRMVVHGYIKVAARGHVLADQSHGQAYEHRLVLYAKIGAGVHPCHWCGRLVSWEFTYPKTTAALVVDHLDDDGLNNDPSNLVPSCNPCNGGRAATARHVAARCNSAKGGR